jgi:hypothetical protein
MLEGSAFLFTKLKLTFVKVQLALSKEISTPFIERTLLLPKLIVTYKKW